MQTPWPQVLQGIQKGQTTAPSSMGPAGQRMPRGTLKRFLNERHSQIKNHWILPEHAPRKFCNNPAVVLIVLRAIIPSFGWVECKRNASRNLDCTP